MKLQNKTTSTRLGGYLTAAVTCGTLANTSSAAVVALDVSSIDGPNGGVTLGSNVYAQLSSLSAGALTGRFLLSNNDYYNTTGLIGYGSAGIASISNFFVNPTNFSSSSIIDASAYFRSNVTTAFDTDGLGTSPDFGPGSYLGFKSANGHYGYLEVTWTSATNTFEILSGAYESVAGTGILAGAAPIPEPSTAMLSLGALAAGAFIRRRKQAA